MKVYEALKLVKTEGQKGICVQLNPLGQNRQASWDWGSNRAVAFKAWPKFSGNYSYPVPYKIFGVLNTCPDKAYWNRPKWTGRYGRDRMELLEHLIAWFEERDL